MGNRGITGEIGEEECARQLESRGWVVTHLTRIRTNYPNADLEIEKGSFRRLIQVKSSRKARGYVTGGGVSPSVVAGGKIFNRATNYRLCDFVIFLATEHTRWRYFVVPCECAEIIFRRNIDAYFKSPRLDGRPRKHSGQADIFVGGGDFPHSRIVPDQRSDLLPFEGRWDLLEASEVSA